MTPAWAWPGRGFSFFRIPAPRRFPPRKAGLMIRFSCPCCQSELWFHNLDCLNCGSRLGYHPRRGFEVLNSQGLSASSARPCANREPIQCNWLCPPDDKPPPGPRQPANDAAHYCASCRHTTVIPDLSVPGNRQRWAELEQAKRALFRLLLALRLPLRGWPPVAPEFHLKGDPIPPPGFAPITPPVLTGHTHGVITVNIGEADAPTRAAQRQAMDEPLRTLISHFRHEIGHFYWDCLVYPDPQALDTIRRLFGDERADYRQALERYYAQGPYSNWNDQFISAYASSHPWEDFAETWAHLFHILDGLETALSYGLIKPYQVGLHHSSGPPAVGLIPVLLQCPMDSLTRAWVELSLALNALNAAMGLQHLYPFVLSPTVVNKLEGLRRFVALGPQ